MVTLLRKKFSKKRAIINLIKNIYILYNIIILYNIYKIGSQVFSISMTCMHFAVTVTVTVTLDFASKTQTNPNSC